MVRQASAKAVVAGMGRDTMKRARLFSSASSKHRGQYYTIGLTGSTGLVGNAFRDELAKAETRIDGKPVRVVRLIRGTHAEQAPDWNATNTTTTTLTWNPHATSPNDIMDPAALDQLDALVHLSGENVATGLGPLGFLGLRPWTNAKKKEIVESRVQTTQALAQAVAASATPKTLLIASGVGVYGDHFKGPNPPEAVDESADVSQTHGFLADVSRQWEGAAQAAMKDSKKRHRVVHMRFGVVQSLQGGALAKLYPIFWLGGGGPVGPGDQYFSFISARDHVRAMVHTLKTPTLQGPVNFCAPEPCTNADFGQAFAKCLNRPAIVPFPSFAVNLLFGEMGQEMLLGGVRAKPTKLLESGFVFEHPTIEQAIQSALQETI